MANLVEYKRLVIYRLPVLTLTWAVAHEDLKLIFCAIITTCQKEVLQLCHVIDLLRKIYFILCKSSYIHIHHSYCKGGGIAQLGMH